MLTRTWLIDAAERVVLTAVETFLGTLLLAAGAFNVSTVHAAAIAGVSAGLAAAKTVIAAKMKGTVSPASLLTAAPTSNRTLGQALGDKGQVHADLLAAAALIGIFVLLLFPHARIH